MSIKNSVLRRCTRAIMEHLEGIKLEDHQEKPPVPILCGSAEKAKEWGFDQANDFLFDDFSMFCLLQKFPVISVELKEYDLSQKLATFQYEINLLAVHKDQMEILTEKINTKIAERKNYKLSPTVVGLDLDIKSIKARQWRFGVEIDGLGGWSDNEKEAVLFEDLKEKLDG